MQNRASPSNLAQLHLPYVFYLDVYIVDKSRGTTRINESCMEIVIHAINHARYAGIALTVVLGDNMREDYAVDSSSVLESLTNALETRGEKFTWRLVIDKKKERVFYIFELTYKAPR